MSESDLPIFNHHVRDSIREIDDNSWIIAERLHLTRAPFVEGYHHWKDYEGRGYHISETLPWPLPETKPRRQDDDFMVVYEAAERIITFEIGQARLKIMEENYEYGGTDEHVTLEWLRQREWSFGYPETIFHTRFGKRYYLITTRVPGEALWSVWESLDDTARDRIVQRLTDIHEELAVLAPEGARITGVDGKLLTDSGLALLRDQEWEFDPETLRQQAEHYGMDCTFLVFALLHMNHTTVFVDRNNDDKISIQDWCLAGWVPQTWIRSRMALDHSFIIRWDGGSKRINIYHEIDMKLFDMGWCDVSHWVMLDYKKHEWAEDIRERCSIL